MTPAARCAAAIEIIDQILEGDAAERALTNWARRSRFAGSKDRAAIRDHVFDALRNKRSFAALGGSDTGRGIILGALRAQGLPVDDVFSGVGHAPAPLTEDEIQPLETGFPQAVRLDCPDWLVPHLQESLEELFEPVMSLLKQRAPVFLRVNARKATREEAMHSLEAEGIVTTSVALSPYALEVTQNPRKVANSNAFNSGLVEIQDAASQYVADQLKVSPNARVLDYCAGGGGKSLAIAARFNANFFAYDLDIKRMSDIPERAKRAGVNIECLTAAQLDAQPNFDVIFVDAPCSGSGAWRRSPDAKWRFNADRLEQLKEIQQDILNKAKLRVSDNGILAYATCSILADENENQVKSFLSQNPDWGLIQQHKLTPVDGGDGFFIAQLKRKS